MKKLFRKIITKRPHKVKVALSDKEFEVLKQIAHDQDISIEHTLRQGLRTYQIVHEEFKKGNDILPKDPPVGCPNLDD
jgi:hypothetical protein